MAHIVLTRGQQVDLYIYLRESANGPLVDDDDWVDGSTAEQWPEVLFESTDAVPVDVTADVVKDITLDAIPDATHEHPDGTTGLWRRVSVPQQGGQYGVRAKPSLLLAPGDYTMKVVFDVLGVERTVTHEVTVVEAGHVDFGQASIYATTAEILSLMAGAELVTEADVIQAGMRADVAIHAYLAGEGISYPRSLDSPEGPALKLAAIAFARAELRRFKAVGNGLPVGLRRVTEGDITMDFISADTLFKSLHEEAAYWIDLAIKAILGSVYFHVSEMNRPSGLR